MKTNGSNSEEICEHGTIGTIELAPGLPHDLPAIMDS
jgi:hypothetical protein